jgi:hypothetical protein
MTPYRVSWLSPTPSLPARLPARVVRACPSLAISGLVLSRFCTNENGLSLSIPTAFPVILVGYGGSQPPVPAAVERGRVKCQKAALRARYWCEPSEWTCSMLKPVPLPPPGFDDLSVDEKIDYLQSLGTESRRLLRRFPS